MRHRPTSTSVAFFRKTGACQAHGSRPHHGQHTRDPSMKQVPHRGSAAAQTPIPPGLHAASRTPVLNCSPLLRQKWLTRKQPFCFKCKLQGTHAPSQPVAFTKPAESTHTTRQPQSHVGRGKRWRATDTRTGGTAHTELQRETTETGRHVCFFLLSSPNSCRGRKEARALLCSVLPVLGPEGLSTASEINADTGPLGPSAAICPSC